jgi:hypothetical protein
VILLTKKNNACIPASMSLLMSLLTSLSTSIIVPSGHFRLDANSSLLAVEIAQVDATVVALNSCVKDKWGHLEELPRCIEYIGVCVCVLGFRFQG